MSICPKCGYSPPDPDGRGSANTEREILIRVPERDFPLMRKTFREMETKLGMYGYGELANKLKPYGDRFAENWEQWRYFDDGAMAMVMFGIVNGFRARVKISPGCQDRVIVKVAFKMRDGNTSEIKLADNATEEAASWFQDYFGDISDRLAPNEEDMKT